MDFSLTPDQLEIRRAVEAICADYMPAYWLKCDTGEIFPEAFYRDTYLLEVRKPAESTSAWNLERVVGSISGNKAFRPTDPAICPRPDPD